MRHEPARATSGQVVFKNGPPANVQIGGKSIGYVTSPTDPLVLPAGEQVLEVLLAKPTELKVVVKAGQTTEVDLGQP